MNLSKKGELLALGSALYLVGLEVEAQKEKLWEMSEHPVNGKIPVTQELLDTLEAHERAKAEFSRLEKRFLELEKEL